MYYEAQGWHYMAVMNLNRVYYCCLYENNEDEVIIRRIDRDMDYELALIVADMDNRCSAVSEDGLTVTWNPVRKSGISKEGLERLKVVHPDIYAGYVTYSESRRFRIKRLKEEAA